MIKKCRIFTTLILLTYCASFADAKTLIISNKIMKKCAFDNRTMSFEKCLWTNGTFRNDPIPAEPPTNPNDPDVPPDEPPVVPPTPPKPPRVPIGDDLTGIATTYIVDGGNEDPETPTPPPPPQPPVPNNNATATASATNGPAAGNEDPEKEACIAAGSTWTNNDWETKEATCMTHTGGGNRWGAIWNHQTMKYECLNAIQWADYEFEHNNIDAQTKEYRYEDYYNVVYDANGNTTPMNTDLQWYIPLTDAEYPTDAKCASTNERECYQQGGGFDWGDFKTGKCYKHSGDKTWCEAIGAKFSKQNGISFCDCKIKNTDLEFHWKSTGSCDWKQGNHSVLGGGSFKDFFEKCLKSDLKDSPIFNGNLYTITGGMLNPHQVLKTLKCK